MLKRFYHILALLALVNLFAVTGLLVYLFASGRLNAERVDQIGEVLRGEYPVSQVACTQPADERAIPQRSRQEIAAVRGQRERIQLVSERLKRESADRKTLDQSVQLQVLRQLEEIESKKKLFEQQKQAFLTQKEQEGFTQALEMYSSINPKLAKDLLKTREKDVDVVRLLMRMESSRRKKIVNACKTPEEKFWIGRILTQVEKQNQTQANGVDGSDASS